MPESFYRPEVSQSRRQEWLGSVRLRPVRMAWPIAVLAGLATTTLLLLFSFGHYTHSEQVAGQLVPAHGLLAVVAPSSGQVVAVHVREGERVAAGQALIELSTERESLETGRVATGIALELEGERQRLKTALNELEKDQSSRQHRLQQRRNSLNRRLALADAQLDIRRQQRDGARNLLERMEPLRTSGQLTLMQIQQFESAALDRQAQYEQARLDRLDLQQEMAELDAEMAELPRQTAMARHDIESRLAELAQAIARNELERTAVLRAPRSGVVSGLTATAGQTVGNGRMLLAVAPEDSILLAELWVPPHAIGLIENGGEAILRYHAYPYQQFGQFSGRIVEIANRALSPVEILDSRGLHFEQPAFRVLVEPEQQYVTVNGKSRALRPSITLDAALTLERRRLAELIRPKPRPNPDNEDSAVDLLDEAGP